MHVNTEVSYNLHTQTLVEDTMLKTQKGATIFRPRKVGRPLKYAHQAMGFEGKLYGKYEYDH